MLIIQSVIKWKSSMSDISVKLSKNIEKSSVLQETFSSIAHQWRQPLCEINSIVSSIDNRLYELGIEDKVLEKELSDIEKITKNMSESIDDFRGYLKQNDTKSHLLDKIVKKALDTTFYTLKEKNIELMLDIESSLEFFGDKQLLKQIIITLIDNARDALVSRNVYDPKIWIKAFKEEQQLFIKVCDNGGGMSKSVMGKIFEPTFTTKHHSEGTGLGLSVARKLTKEKLNASLYIKNVDSGACFTIEFLKD